MTGSFLYDSISLPHPLRLVYACPGAVRRESVRRMGRTVFRMGRELSKSEMGERNIKRREGESETERESEALYTSTRFTINDILILFSSTQSPMIMALSPISFFIFCCRS